MTDTELQDLHARFERTAFYGTNNRPRLTPEVKLCDMAWVMIKSHHGWQHEWWKDYTGIIVLAKMIFHKTSEGWHYLYEVIPVKIAGHVVYVARSIPANCIHVIESAMYATDSRAPSSRLLQFGGCHP